MKNYFLMCAVMLMFISTICSGKSTNRQRIEKLEDTLVKSKQPEIKLVYQHASPVITVKHPDAAGNKFGFEGGSVVKIDSTYHLLTSEMIDNPMWVKMRLAHWTSTDKVNWKRIGTVRESSGEFDGKDPRAALWSPMVVWDSLDNRWNLFYVAYNSEPNIPGQFHLNMKGKIFRSMSDVVGKEGINGPYTDKGIILSFDKDPDPWEGLQGTDSFYPYQVGGGWYAFYGSANTEKIPIEHWLVGYAKSETNSIVGPWKRMSEKNPAKIEKIFIENPIVTKVAGGYMVIYDSQKSDALGWAFSKDGINWDEGQSLIIQPKEGLWSKDVRTVLGLIDEGNGKCTVFYTGFEQVPDWNRLLTGKGLETCAIGYVELKIE